MGSCSLLEWGNVHDAKALQEAKVGIAKAMRQQQ
jgi:hypothetical protein